MSKFKKTKLTFTVLQNYLFLFSILYSYKINKITIILQNYHLAFS